MEHQYPGAISGDENMLAELMLPDQAHARKEDWTIFFLHKDTSEDEETAEDGEGDDKQEEEQKTGENAAENGTKEGNDDGGVKGGEVEDHQEEDEGGEGPPLIYVLNLVNTKHDPTAKRLDDIPIPLKLETTSNRSFLEAQLSRRWQSVRDIPFYTFIKYVFRLI